MANNRVSRYIGAIALGTVLMAMPGCTDSWDDHYGDVGASSASSNQTLWDIVSANPEYSRFMDIVKNAKYYKDISHPVASYTYEDVLKGDQVNTLWIPDNSVLTEAEYQKWMQMCESGSAEDGYNVQQQFLGNHIALFRHNVSGTGVEKVRMINGKNLMFDMTNRTLQGVPLATGEGEINIPAKNGLVHLLKGIAPFRYNLYEYLKYSQPLTKLGAYVASKDVMYFYKDLSKEGLPDENGNPTYVDSVYSMSNRLIESVLYYPENANLDTIQMYQKGFGAYINREDSAYVMITPTNEALDKAYQMLADAYKYAPKYENKAKVDNDEAAENISLTQEQIDSLQRMSIQMDIVAPLVFNVNRQPKWMGSEMWTLAKFKELKGETGITDRRGNFLINTIGDTIRNTPTWNRTSLFDAEPTEMSNGLAYNVTSWNFPKEYYTPDVEVEVESSYVFYNKKSKDHSLGSMSDRHSFPNDVYKDITSLYGHVSNNNFYHLDGDGDKAKPKAWIRLKGNSSSAYVPGADVMSGKYDVQLVLVPHWYLDIANEGKIPEKFYKTDTIVSEENPEDTTFNRHINTEYIEELASKTKYKFRTKVSYTDGKSVNKNYPTSPKDREWTGLKVDTVTVIEDMEFPYSYKNMRMTYPALYVEGRASDTNVSKNGFLYDLVIDKVILKRK